MAHTREQYLKVLRYEPYKIGHMVGFDKLALIHNEWMKWMLYGNNDITLLAHRLSYKTTCVSVVLTLLVTFHPSKQILFMRKTDADTVEIISQVKKIIANEQYQAFVQACTGRTIDIVKSNSVQINTNFNSSPRGTSQLLGIGTSASLTGKHYDYIFTDDIVNLKDRQSKAQRQRIKGVYQELQNIRTHGGRIINTGTPWHKEDAITDMPNVMRFSCYDTGIMSDELIEQKKKSMTPSLFAANYELQHIAAQDALFKELPTYTMDESLIRDGLAHIDASYGGSDYTAFTAGAYNADTNTIYMYGKIWHKHVDTVMNYIIDDINRLMVAPVYCEDNGDKGYLCKELKRRDMFARSYHESENKIIKISSYLRKWWTNIVWIEGTDKEYIDQIMTYTEDAEHDDAADSAACVCRLLDRHAPSYE